MMRRPFSLPSVPLLRPQRADLVPGSVSGASIICREAK